MRPGEIQETPNTRLPPRHSCGGGRSPPAQAADAQSGPARLAAAWPGSAAARAAGNCAGAPGAARALAGGAQRLPLHRFAPQADTFHCEGGAVWRPPHFSSLGRALGHRLGPPEGAGAPPACARRWSCLRPPTPSG